jgi:hypothetical protein
MEVGCQRHAPTALSPGNRPGTLYVGGWVGPRAGLDGCGKSRPPTGIRSPDRPARSDLVPGAMACVRAQEETTRGSGGAVGASFCAGNISPAL